MTSTQVLVVEDDPFIAQLISETLSEERFQSVLCESGADALTAAEAAPPDVVLLDIRLPGELDGLEVCRRLRAASKPPIVIFLTGLADNDDVRKGEEAGGSAYLIKPFSPLDLLDLLDAQLDRA